MPNLNTGKDFDGFGNPDTNPNQQALAAQEKTHASMLDAFDLNDATGWEISQELSAERRSQSHK